MMTTTGNGMFPQMQESVEDESNKFVYNNTQTRNS